MRFTPLAFLLAAASCNFLVSAKQKENCPPKPEPIYNIKFTDKDGDAFHNYELHGTARIVEPAPEPVTRALRIDQIYSYALLKGIDISRSKMPDVTLAIGVYIESIRPMHPDGKRRGAPESLAHGWVMGHDNGGFDRAIFLHDQRFNGMGISPGYTFPANARWTEPAQKTWLQIVAIWRQGGECEMYEGDSKVQFSKKVIGNNKNDGLPNLSIGSLEQRRYGAVNDNDVWIKDVQIWDYALDKDELDALDCDFNNDLEPNIDCGDGRPLVESCTDCPFQEGDSAGCGGDCVYEKELPICREDDGNDVDCGDHDASDCSQCDATPEDTSGCAGECKWDLASNSCKDQDYQPPIPPVNCGHHQAHTCEECTNGGPDGCAGDCMWNPFTGTCVEGDPNDDDVNCGTHRANECGDCANGRNGCSGDCKWFAASNKCVPNDFDPVDCGGGRLMVSCAHCGTPGGCYGDCVWSNSISQCINKPPYSNVNDCGDHQATSCGQCGANSNKVLPSGNYYTGDYNKAYPGDAGHEILSTSWPDGSGVYSLTKNHGDRFVGAGQVSIKIYTRGQNQHFIRNTEVKYSDLRYKYCNSGRTKYPAHFRLQYNGCRGGYWTPAWVVFFTQDTFVLFSKNGAEQHAYRRPTASESSRYLRRSPRSCSFW